MSMTKSRPAKDFQLFKKECERWIKKFNLDDWRIYYEFADLGEKDGATIQLNLRARKATIGLNKFIYEGIPDSIQEMAKHEAIHLLLGRLSELARKRFCDHNDIYEAEEELVQKLLKIIK